MRGGLTVIIEGLIVFIIAGIFISQLITGTDAGSTLIQSVMLVVIGAGIVLLAVAIFMGAAHRRKA